MLNNFFSIIIYFYIHKKIIKIYTFVSKNFDLNIKTITNLNNDLKQLKFNCNNDSFTLKFDFGNLKKDNNLYLYLFSNKYIDFKFSYIGTNVYNEIVDYNFSKTNFEFYTFKLSSLIELYKIINNIDKVIQNYKINQNNEILNYFDFKGLDYVK